MGLLERWAGLIDKQKQNKKKQGRNDTYTIPTISILPVMFVTGKVVLLVEDCEVSKLVMNVDVHRE